ncbi:MAG TPA: PqqD family protein [Thermodesulfovibrionales bacterium]|nr:PqqD family protein [Thermodesulfovibrionales bacterium]
MKEVYKKKNEIVYRKVAGETILVPISGRLADMQRIFALNPVGEFIWDEIDGSKTLQQVSKDIQSSFDVTGEEATADLEAFIAELFKEGLIEEAFQ